MTEEAEIELEESFAGPEPKSSASVLSSIKKAEDAYRSWQTVCETIDAIYSRDGDAWGKLSGFFGGGDVAGWDDSALDLFWSSFEILKPAIYARPPQPVVVPLFKDSVPLYTTTAELLERCSVSVFKRTDINDVMLQARDDLIFAGRGVLWLRYEKEDGQHKVVVEHKDRLDFLHEPARKWSEVGWVAGGAWMTRKEMRERFYKRSGNAYMDAAFTVHREDDRDREKQTATKKAKVWEVWHKANNRVYWVTAGVDKFLDEGEPHLDLSDFFPCPKPAFATLKRRSLIPVPDWERYAVHFRKISELTRRIYSLLNAVKMKGLVAGGGDIGEAIESIIKDESDEVIIPVPGAAMLAHGAAPLVVWLPLNELAQAIQGLIAARSQLIDDFYQLSGISDIMRGATEAEETLGAQQLKSQYGSVRVREKSAELQRVAADAVKIAAEIIAEKFPKDTLLEMSQMEILERKAIDKRVKDVERAAEEELKALGKKAREAAEQAQQSGQQVDPAQAEAMFTQAQQEIFAKYAPMLMEAEQRIPIEDVMKLLRDDRVRNFVFEIESSSTILTDELQEKRSRNEFLEAFAGAQQALMGIAAMGEEGAQLAGAMLKFAVAPYRAGRELDGAIDQFIEKAPEMARLAAAQNGEDQGIEEAQKMLAQAEMEKAKAAMANVEAKAALDKAEMQRKIMEMQGKGQEAQFKAQVEAQRLQSQLAETQAKLAKTEAETNKLTAQTAEILEKIGLDARKQELAEYQAAETAGREMDAVDGGGEGTQEPSEGSLLMQGLNQLGQLVVNQGNNLAAAVSAPTEIIRDQNGRPIGARKVTQ